MNDRSYALYEEVTPWPWWAAGIVWLSVAGGVAAVVWDTVLRGGPVRIDALVVGGLIAAGILLVGVSIRTLFGRLRTVVTHTSISLTYGYTRLIRKVIPFDEIEEVEPVRYRPIVEFGGWGLRFGLGGKKKAWTVRGDGAVVLTLADGILFYVGSDRPGRLAERIRTAMERHRRERAGVREREGSGEEEPGGGADES